MPAKKDRWTNWDKVSESPDFYDILDDIDNERKYLELVGTKEKDIQKKIDMQLNEKYNGREHLFLVNKKLQDKMKKSKELFYKKYGVKIIEMKEKGISAPAISLEIGISIDKINTFYREWRYENNYKH